MSEHNTPEKQSRMIYISGPMTGIAGHNFAAFDAAELALREKGWRVVSPANIARKNGVSEGSSVDSEELRQIQEQDLEALLTCKAVFMLKGWRDSKGAKAEFHVAKWLQLEVQFEAGAETPIEAVSEGLDPKGAEGDKKAPVWLFPPCMLEEASWVHGLGAKKYGPWNWRKSKKVKASTYISAVNRHFNLAWARGEDNDLESGRSHLAHVVACCNILRDAQLHNCLHDDRMTPDIVGEGVA